MRISLFLHLGQPRHFFVRVLVRLPPRLLFIAVRYQEFKRITIQSCWLGDALLQVYIRNFQYEPWFGLATWREVWCIATMHVRIHYSSDGLLLVTLRVTGFEKNFSTSVIDISRGCL